MSKVKNAISGLTFIAVGVSLIGGPVTAVGGLVSHVIQDNPLGLVNYEVSSTLKQIDAKGQTVDSLREKYPAVFLDPSNGEESGNRIYTNISLDEKTGDMSICSWEGGIINGKPFDGRALVTDVSTGDKSINSADCSQWDSLNTMDNAEVIASSAPDKDTPDTSLNEMQMIFGGLGAGAAGFLAVVGISIHDNKKKLEAAKNNPQLSSGGDPEPGDDNTSSVTVPAIAPDTTTPKYSLDSLNTRYQKVFNEWAAYELNIMNVVEYPLMSDMRDSKTVDFHRSMALTKDCKEISNDNPENLSFLDDYAKALRDMEINFSIAEQNALLNPWRGYDPEEKDRLDSAKKLFALALDEGATENEQRVAYRQGMKEVKNLVKVPDLAVAAIETKIQASITA